MKHTEKITSGNADPLPSSVAGICQRLKVHSTLVLQQAVSGGNIKPKKSQRL